MRRKETTDRSRKRGKCFASSTKFHEHVLLWSPFGGASVAAEVWVELELVHICSRGVSRRSMFICSGILFTWRTHDRRETSPALVWKQDGPIYERVLVCFNWEILDVYFKEWKQNAKPGQTVETLNWRSSGITWRLWHSWTRSSQDEAGLIHP